MRLLVLSDLHIEFGDFTPPAAEFDAVVLAGDIWDRDRGIRWAASHFPANRVIYVLGNHEFYGEEFRDVVDACRRAARDTGVNFLENDRVIIDGVRFLGSALWTDFSLYGEKGDVRRAMLDAMAGIRDFKVIAMSGKTAWGRFLPEHMVKLNKASRSFLKAEFAKPFPGKTVVVTHFLPSPGSIAPKYEGDILNPYFCTNLDSLIKGAQPELWIHGHTHDSFDYTIGKTRVVCNPRGYDGYELNPAFDPCFVVEL